MASSFNPFLDAARKHAAYISEDGKGGGSVKKAWYRFSFFVTVIGIFCFCAGYEVQKLIQEKNREGSFDAETFHLESEGESVPLHELQVLGVDFAGSKIEVYYIKPTLPLTQLVVGNLNEGYKMIQTFQDVPFWTNSFEGKSFVYSCSGINFLDRPRWVKIKVEQIQSAFSAEVSDSHDIAATTSGSNSPAYAAGRDVNVQNGVSDSTVQQLLNLKAVELSERMLSEYPHGCLLLGLENGKVIFDSRLKDIQMDADWDNATITINGGNVKLIIPKLAIVSGGIHLSTEIAESNFPFVEHKPVRTSWFNFYGLSLYCEVLDKDRDIFIIGCK